MPRPQGSSAQGRRQEQGSQRPPPRHPRWLMRSRQGEDGLENQGLGPCDPVRNAMAPVLEPAESRGGVGGGVPVSKLNL